MLNKLSSVPFSISVKPKEVAGQVELNLAIYKNADMQMQKQPNPVHTNTFILKPSIDSLSDLKMLLRGHFKSLVMFALGSFRFKYDFDVIHNEIDLLIQRSFAEDLLCQHQLLSRFSNDLDA